MSSRDVVFMVAIPFKRDIDSYVQHSVATWRAWCQRNGVRLVVWDRPLCDVALMKPTWQRYRLFELLDAEGIEFDRVAYVDSDTMVRWDCPNFFGLAGDHLGVVRDNSPGWSFQSMKAHRKFFPGVDLPWYDYFNAGFQVLNQRHRSFYQAILQFYDQHRDQLLSMERAGGLGTDQTPVNFLARREGNDLTYLPPTFNLLPLHKLMKDHLYVEMGYVWHFAGIPHDLRVECMRHTWESFRGRYE